jgi:hypothetical protein
MPRCSFSLIYLSARAGLPLQTISERSPNARQRPNLNRPGPIHNCLHTADMTHWMSHSPGYATQVADVA